MKPFQPIVWLDLKDFKENSSCFIAKAFSVCIMNITQSWGPAWINHVGLDLIFLIFLYNNLCQAWISTAQCLWQGKRIGTESKNRLWVNKCSPNCFVGFAEYRITAALVLSTPWHLSGFSGQVGIILNLFSWVFQLDCLPAIKTVV